MRAIIDIFTRPYCEACDKAKAKIAASAPESHGVTVNVHDAGEDSSIKSVPLIIIGDEPQISGYSAAAIDQALTNLYASLVPEETPPDETTPDETPPEPEPLPPPLVYSEPIAKPGPSKAAIVILAAVVGFVAHRFLSSR